MTEHDVTTQGAASQLDVLPAKPPKLVIREWVSKEHLGLSLTLGYLFLASVGMVHRALVLFGLRINVFDYAEPSDFVIAALRDPLIVIATLAPIPLVWLYYRFATWLQVKYGRKNPSERTLRQRAQMQKYRPQLFVLTVLLWCTAFTLSYANRVRNALRAGEGRRVHVDLVTGSLRSGGDTTAFLLAGTTQKYIFLYDDKAAITTVVPSSNIARIMYDRKRR